jgi:trigger factor
MKGNPIAGGMLLLSVNLTALNKKDVEVKRTNADELNAVLSISLKKEDYLPKVDKALTQYRNTVAIKGFRKGHVPTGLIKKMYGNAILMEELNKSVTDAINQHIQEEKLEILGRPLPKNEQQLNIDINEPNDLNFEYEIGLVPKFSLPELAKAKIEKLLIGIDDKTLDDELDKLAQRYGNVENPEGATVEVKDILAVDFKELDGKAEKENGVQHSGVINTEMIKDEKLKKKVLGAKAGDTLTVNPFEAFDRDRDSIAKQLLGLKDGEPEGMSETFSMTITKISRIVKAEFNQELFDKVYGPETVKSLEDFKERVRKELQQFANQNSANKFKDSIYQFLLDNTNINFPDAFLKRFIQVSNEKPVSEDQIEQEYPNFSKGLKWNLITGKLSKDHDLKIEFEDVKAFSREQVKRQFEMYNPTGGAIDDKTIDLLNDNMLSKEEHVKKSYDGAMEQKLFTFIENQVQVVEKPVTFDEFFNKK